MTITKPCFFQNFEMVRNIFNYYKIKKNIFSNQEKIYFTKKRKKYIFKIKKNIFYKKRKIYFTKSRKIYFQNQEKYIFKVRGTRRNALR